MEHADGVARRLHRDDVVRRSPGPVARPSRDGVTAGWWATAGVGLALTLGVGIATVTATLAEAGGAAPAPPTGSVPSAAVPAAPVAPSPQMLRLWGLRAGPSGILAPYVPTDPVPRTAMEQLYADLLPVPHR